MRQSIGAAFSLNIIIVFIVIVFSSIAGILSYTKAFRVNSKIVNAIEKHEGWNDPARKEITEKIKILGYYVKDNNINCPVRDGIKGQSDAYQQYCVYQHEVKNNYIEYGILTYMYFDIPVVGRLFKIPIYTITDRIYVFE